MALKFIDTATPKGNFPIAYASDIVMDDDRLNENLETTIDTLKTRVDNLSNLGRFLAVWDASTGAPTSEPTESPYTFHVGDYYRIGATGTRNPAPNLTYTIGGVNWVEGEQLKNKDVIYISNITATATTWVVQESSGGGEVQDVLVNGVSKLSGGIANIDEVPASIVTGTLNTNQIPNLNLSKITDVTATVNEVNVLDGITATTQELNYTDGVTSNIQTQLDSKLEGVQVNGTDLSVTNKKVNIPIAGASLGVSKPGSGLVINASTGAMSINKASNSAIEGKTEAYNPIVPANLNKAIMEGLGNNSLTWTDQYKSNARSKIGAGTVSNLSDLSITATNTELNVLDGITATTLELNYTDGVTSNIQTQLDSKQVSVNIRRVTQ